MLLTPFELAPVMAGVTAYHLELFLMLAALSVSYSASVRRIERLRRGLTNGKVPNVLNVWTMAGALILPPVLIVSLVVVSYAAEWPSRRIVGGGRPVRYAVSAAVIMVAALAASISQKQIGGLLGTGVAIVVWLAVNSVLIAGLVWLFGDRKIIGALLAPRNLAFETVTNIVGVAVASAAAWHLSAALSVLPVLLVGHRLALRDSINETAAFDPQTGLWSEAGWRICAGQAADQAPACVVLLLIDPELSNQEAQIASCLTGFRRPTDPIGRYGTRQVALLSQVDLEPAGVILVKRIRDRLAQAGITCLVGTSISAGEDLDVLLMRAGSDLMQRRAAAGISARW
jgi:hypothetical protein